ncbi:transposase [Anopheles sinensis]|uniref:Transposase n=1 Tax=Anopheles sinensis TaxID=74873 RepID=A0A084VSD5_ANOSI|nr:transposase [Anopheles sinensis]
MGRRADVSNENRKKIVRSYLDRTSIGQIARDMNIHKSTVSCIVTKYLKTGSYCKERRQRNTPKKLNEKQIEAIGIWVEQDLYISLQSIANRCLNEFGVEVSKTTVDKYLKSICRNNQATAATG